LAAGHAQLRDLLKHIDEGRIHHAFGLANLLGQMITKGEPMALVQTAAAEIGGSLTVYTSADPDLPIPIAPHGFIALNIRAVPTDVCWNPVDLDVWLETAAAIIDGQKFSHRKVIDQIRNKVGSHFSRDIAPLVAFLKSTSSAATYGGNVHDHLVEYVRNLAHVTAHLSENILQRTEPSPPA
jgi:hypothetical protein